MTRIAFIGGGNMARSLIGGLLRTGHPASSVSVSAPRSETLQALGREFGVTTYSDNRRCIAEAELVVLATKPTVLAQLGPELKPLFSETRPLLVSVAAGAQLEQLGRWFGPTLAIVRAMPNTPALIGAGACGLCANAHVSAPQRVLAQHVMDTGGLTRWVKHEAQMNAVTAVSGSGPAYFFAFVEAMEAAAIEQGLEPEVAHALAVQTCLGAGRMLSESNESATELRRRVTSPNGTTQAALEDRKSVV